MDEGTTELVSGKQGSLLILWISGLCAWTALLGTAFLHTRPGFPESPQAAGSAGPLPPSLQVDVTSSFPPLGLSAPSG